MTVREVVEGDWRAFASMYADPEVVRFMSNGVLDEATTRERVLRSIAAARERPRRVYEYAFVVGGEVLGRGGFVIERPEHKEAMLFFTLRREAWGKGYVTAGMRQVLPIAFGEAGLHRVWGDADPRNVGSIRVMEKLGMKREAHLRENWWLKGEWCDSIVFGLLDREWRDQAASAPAKLG